MTDVFFVLLGWLLGMASTLILNFIQKKNRLKELNSTILAEMDELRYRLTYTRFKIEVRADRVDRNFVSWLGIQEMAYSGIYRDEEFSSDLGKLADLSDEEFESVLSGLQQPQGKAIGLKRQHMPALSGSIQSIGGFPEEYQRVVFDILRIIQAMNEEIEQAMKFFHMTFDDNLTDLQKTATRANVESSYDSISNFCLWTIDAIARLDTYKDHKFALSAWLRDVNIR